MSGKYPTPVVREGKWEVDLRSWGFKGWHYVLGPAELPQLQAVHRAYAKLEELRAARLAEPGAQLELRPVAGAPRTFAEALDEWERRKQYDTDAGAAWGKKYTALVRADLGTYALAEFQGHAGEDRMLAYLRSLEALGLGSRTIRNRFSIVLQVLRLAADRRWLDGVARAPKMPRRPPPRYEWIDEATFRAVRAKLFDSDRGRRVLERHARARGCREPAAVLVERRKVYLSLLFYLGLHPADAAAFSDDHIYLDAGAYRRHNNKSAACVPDEQFELPEPLIDDVRALLALLGREAFYCGELIGGPWPDGARNNELQAIQEELGIKGAPLCAQVMRRSFAREMFRRGYSIAEVAARMGHVDETMLREVYARTPRPIGRARTRWTRTPIAGAPTTHAGARVVQFRPTEVSDDA